MTIISLKNAVRRAIFDRDNSINFFFNEILKVQYPYVFFYIPSFRLTKAINDNDWQKATVMCVIEYAKDEDSTTAELWEFSNILSEVYNLFEFQDTKISAKNVDFKIVEGVLQMTFDLEFYIKQTDNTEAMEELNLQLK